MREAAEKYLDHLDGVFKVEPEFQRFSEESEYPPFHILTYRDIPESGMLTSITSGISFVDQPEENNLRPELLISVVSQDISWALAIADIGYQHRGKLRFKQGDTINFNAKISEESDMSSFFIWPQGVINESHEMVCLPEWHILIMGIYPIHDDERILIHEHGPDWLFNFVEDPCDVRRPSVAYKFKT